MLVLSTDWVLTRVGYYQRGHPIHFVPSVCSHCPLLFHHCCDTASRALKRSRHDCLILDFQPSKLWASIIIFSLISKYPAQVFSYNNRKQTNTDRLTDFTNKWCGPGLYKLPSDSKVRAVKPVVSSSKATVNEPVGLSGLNICFMLHLVLAVSTFP